MSYRQEMHTGNPGHGCDLHLDNQNSAACPLNLYLMGMCTEFVLNGIYSIVPYRLFPMSVYLCICQRTYTYEHILLFLTIPHKILCPRPYIHTTTANEHTENKRVVSMSIFRGNKIQLMVKKEAGCMRTLGVNESCEQA